MTLGKSGSTARTWGFSVRVMVIALAAFPSLSSPLTSSQLISREPFLINSTWSHHPWLTASSEQGHGQVQSVLHLMTVPVSTIMYFGHSLKQASCLFFPWGLGHRAWLWLGWAKPGLSVPFLSTSSPLMVRCLGAWRLHIPQTAAWDQGPGRLLNQALLPPKNVPGGWGNPGRQRI